MHKNPQCDCEPFDCKLTLVRNPRAWKCVKAETQRYRRNRGVYYTFFVYSDVYASAILQRGCSLRCSRRKVGLRYLINAAACSLHFTRIQCALRVARRFALLQTGTTNTSRLRTLKQHCTYNGDTAACSRKLRVSCIKLQCLSNFEFSRKPAGHVFSSIVPGMKLKCTAPRRRRFAFLFRNWADGFAKGANFV